MLYFKEYTQDTSTSQRPTLLILHGLFGSNSNWQGMAKQFARSHKVLAVDLRNHGQSPWYDEHDYPTMAQDVAQLISQQQIGPCRMLGHSMGGKVAMQLALAHQDRVQIERLIVADIAPVTYQNDEHLDLIDALQSIDLSMIESRSDADKALASRITEKPVRQFLLQNLVLNEQQQWSWRLNLDSLKHNMDAILAFPDDHQLCQTPSLFVYGEQSHYASQAAQQQAILTLFQEASLAGLPKAGHWLHAEQPKAFLQQCIQFLEVT